MIERGLEEVGGELHSVFRPRMYGYEVQTGRTELSRCTHSLPKIIRPVNDDERCYDDGP
jgi:hypothetical protein